MTTWTKVKMRHYQPSSIFEKKNFSKSSILLFLLFGDQKKQIGTSEIKQNSRQEQAVVLIWKKWKQGKTHPMVLKPYQHEAEDNRSQGTSLLGIGIAYLDKVSNHSIVIQLYDDSDQIAVILQHWDLGRSYSQGWDWNSKDRDCPSAYWHWSSWEERMWYLRIGRQSLAWIKDH